MCHGFIVEISYWALFETNTDTEFIDIHSKQETKYTKVTGKKVGAPIYR